MTIPLEGVFIVGLINLTLGILAYARLKIDLKYRMLEIERHKQHIEELEDLLKKD